MNDITQVSHMSGIPGLPGARSAAGAPPPLRSFVHPQRHLGPEGRQVKATVEYHII